MKVVPFWTITFIYIKRVCTHATKLHRRALSLPHRIAMMMMIVVCACEDGDVKKYASKAGNSGERKAVKICVWICTLCQVKQIAIMMLQKMLFFKEESFSAYFFNEMCFVCMSDQKIGMCLYYGMDVWVWHCCCVLISFYDSLFSTITKCFVE